MITLGLCWGHDSHAVIIRNGIVIAAVGEERISRLKNHYGFPYKAISEVLRIANIAPNEVSNVAIANRIPSEAWKTKLSFDKKFKSDLSNTSNIKARLGFAFSILRSRLEKFKLVSKSKDLNIKIRDVNLKKALTDLGINCSPVFFDHHHCHAASVYFGSDKKCNLIIIADQYGDDKCVSIWAKNEEKLVLEKAYNDIMSPGAFYTEITNFIGFKRHRHEGKVTGLAAYGEHKTLYDLMKPCLKFDESGFSQLHPYKPTGIKNIIWYLTLLFGTKVMENNFEGYNRYFKSKFLKEKNNDIAAAAQKVLEEFCIDLTMTALGGKSNAIIGLAGGIFANVTVNRYINEIKGVDNIYVHQNMGDGGLAMGAAYILHNRLLTKSKVIGMKDVYLGNACNNIESSIKKYRLAYFRPKNLINTIANALSRGKIVGIVRGRMEYGPRALCNRSILAEPVDNEINQSLNNRLNRTEFMPFAPVITIENARKIFIGFKDSDVTSQFMTISYKVFEQFHDIIPGVVHLDGTARPQVVTEESNPFIHKLLNEYELISGIPAFINTSFNVHEEPIVYSTIDAIRAFKFGAVDCLIIEDYLIE